MINISVYAVINPALQPDVYYQNYDNVLVLEISSVDSQKGILTCTVKKAIKGNYYPIDSKITITFTGLEPRTGETPVLPVQPGQRGIAREYEPAP